LITFLKEELPSQTLGRLRAIQQEVFENRQDEKVYSLLDETLSDPKLSEYLKKNIHARLTSGKPVLSNFDNVGFVAEGND